MSRRRQGASRIAVSRKQRPTSCATVEESTCKERIAYTTPKDDLPSFKTVNPILFQQGVTAPVEERKRFVEVLLRAIRQRDVIARHWTIITDHDDIIALIQSARESGDIDEAIWRSFLAAHFGRPSAHGDRQIQSASRFLCAFHTSPFWAWKRVLRNPAALREWLFECAEDLETLAFGNHRKYESQKPVRIWSVIDSFVSLAGDYGTPMELFSVDADESNDEFDALYRRLCPLKRFGRTGRFDFLVLLLDLGCISAEPTSCYLVGATGPLAGAKLLWDESEGRELDRLAAELSERLGVSPIVLEDALCNWQK